MEPARSLVRHLASAGPPRRLATAAHLRCPATAAPVRCPATAAPPRCPATAGLARRVQGGPHGLGLGLYPPARPYASYVQSRQFSVNGPSPEKDKYEKFLKFAQGLFAVIGCASTIGGMIAGAGYWVITSVEQGLDEKLKLAADAIAAKLESEKIRRVEFQTIATKTHLDTVRKLDEIVADLRAQFNNLSVRYLEGQHLESFYRSQILKAQEVLDRKGVTTSSEVHIQLLPKIVQLQVQIDMLTEEITEMRLTNKNSGAASIVNEPADTASTDGLNVKNSGTTAIVNGPKDSASTDGLNVENSSVAREEGKKVATSTGMPKEPSDVKNTKTKVSKVEGGAPRPPK